MNNLMKNTMKNFFELVRKPVSFLVPNSSARCEFSGKEDNYSRLIMFPD